jgi:membrane protein
VPKFPKVIIVLAQKTSPKAQDASPAAKKERPFNEPRSSEQPLDMQLRRAREHGRGRSANHPLQIPWAGWRDIFWRTYSEMNSDRLLSIAGGVAFFILFAIFPAITALVSAYGIFFNASTIGQDLSLLQGVVPGNVLGILNEQASRIAAQSNRALSIGLIAGILVTLWSAMGGVKAMIDALNVIYEERETRSLIKLNLVALVFTLGGFAVFLLAVGTVIVAPLVLSWIGFGDATAGLVRMVRWPVLLIVLLVGLAILYRYGPNRRAARWQWVSVGSVFATVVWLAASFLFSWYLAKFNTYNATYGSLGAVLAMMMWLWISSVVVLLGAELNAEIEHQTAQDSTVGGDKPLGERGAVMADRVGAKQE